MHREHLEMAYCCEEVMWIISRMRVRGKNVEGGCNLLHWFPWNVSQNGNEFQRENIHAATLLRCVSARQTITDCLLTCSSRYLPSTALHSRQRLHESFHDSNRNRNLSARSASIDCCTMMSYLNMSNTLVATASEYLVINYLCPTLVKLERGHGLDAAVTRHVCVFVHIDLWNVIIVTCHRLKTMWLNAEQSNSQWINFWQISCVTVTTFTNTQSV